MAFDINKFVAAQSTATKPKAGGFNVNDFLKKQGVTLKADLTTPEGLAQKAREVGLGDQAEAILNPKPKLSFIQRLSKGLGVLNPAEAILTGIEEGSLTAGLGKYITGAAKGAASAITGTDYEGERRTFADVAEKLGVENGIAKFGIGLVGDILLDPSTYFGGAIARGVVGGAKGATNIALKGVGKVAPDVEKGLRIAGTGLKDATGKAFKFGYGTTEGIAQKGLTIESKLNKAKMGIVSSNIARLGTNTLSPSQQEELVEKLLAGKRTEFGIGKGTEEAAAAAREAAKSSDPAVQKIIEEQSKRSQKFAGQAGIDDPFEIYFPGLKQDNIKNLFDTSSKLKVGSQGYLKQFKNLLTDKELIKNPAEAFATREFQIVKDSIVKSELDKVVKDFGLPAKSFKSAEDATKAGYKAVKDIGYLKEVDANFLDNMITPKFTALDTIARATGYDALTALFKRSVTGLFAPFHVRNFVSGVLQNFEVLGPGALNPANIAAGQKLAWKIARGEKFANEIVNIGGKDINLGKAFKAFEERFGTSSQYIADIADATKGAGNIPGKILSKESFKETGKTLGLGQQSIPFRAARAIGNYIETQQKGTAFITALGQGKNVDEALKLAERAGFDYRALTGFESKVLKRIIPFYSFTRKNLELQLRTLGENPERINQIIKTIENAQSLTGQDLTEEERAKLPDYLKEQFIFKFGTDKAGLPELAGGLGTPVEQPGSIFGENPIRRIFSTFNPILKIPLERSFNIDFFRNRKLSEVIEAGDYAKAPEFIKDFLQLKEVTKKNKDGTTRIVYQGDPERLHLLRNLPSSRGVSYLNQIFSEEATGTTKALQAVTGVKPKAIDLDTVQYFKDRDKQRELEDLLIRAGVLKRLEKAYQPKK